MPKKTRKAKIRAARRPVGGYMMPSTLQAPTETLAMRPSSSVATPSRSIPVLSFDYGYVYSDLRRIALLAAFFFALMFVLWFLIDVQHIPIFPGLT